MMPDSRDAHDSVRTKKINITSVPLYSTPRPGAIEYYNDRMYLTNVGVQKAIDRTGDVVLSSTTVNNTTVETDIFSAIVGTDALKIGNVLKLVVSGLFSSASAADLVTLRVKIGGVTTDTIESPGAQYTDDCWDIDGWATVRSVGIAGSLTYFNKLTIASKTEKDCATATIDTTGSNDITITAQWNNEKVGNSITIAQGFMEYKN